MLGLNYIDYTYNSGKTLLYVGRLKLLFMFRTPPPKHTKEISYIDW